MRSKKLHTSRTHWYHGIWDTEENRMGWIMTGKAEAGNRGKARDNWNMDKSEENGKRSRMREA